MSTDILRPRPINEHPLKRRTYRVPTPSIKAMIALVDECLFMFVGGALIHGRPRMGKSCAIDFVMTDLKARHPKLATYKMRWIKPQAPSGRVSTELRYCKQCLEMGFHAAWFQWLSAERCPLHRVFLRSGCFDCSAPIPYAVGACLAVSPLRCPTCTRDWVPSLSRPGGSCDPIDGAAARLMQNWGEYVNDAGSRESYVRRDHQTGQYLVDRSLASDSAATRPHFVTMVNRLFEMPPPSLRQVSGAYKADRESSVSPPIIDARLSRAGAHKAGFEVRLWPHFTGDFVVFERLVHDMRRQVFGSQRFGLEGAQAARLLLGGMVAESTALAVDEAAAIGWSVSWLGQSRTFAPSSELLLPATGLAAWLARLPIRSAVAGVRLARAGPALANPRSDSVGDALA